MAIDDYSVNFLFSASCAIRIENVIGILMENASSFFSDGFTAQKRRI